MAAVSKRHSAEPSVYTLPLREYQIPFFYTFIDYLEDRNGISRYVLCYLRRAGKDYVANHAIRLASSMNVGTYIFAAKTITMAWNILCGNIDTNTKQTKLDSIYGDLVEAVDRKSFTITFRNGSILQVVATDDFDKVRGLSINGIVISEAAFCRSGELLDVVQPSLDETGGFSILVSTPNGKNHFYDSFVSAKAHEDSFAELITNDEAKIFSEAKLASTLRHLESTKGKSLGRQVYEREFFCSFDTSVLGSVYDAEQIELAVRAEVNYNADYPVYAALDLGYRDHTSIWIYQYYDNKWRFLSAYENLQRSIEHYIAKTLELAPTQPLYIVLPHDARNKNLATGTSIEQVFWRHRLNTMVIPRTSILEGLSAVRREFPSMQISESGCREGITALRNYRYDYDEDKGILSERPLHDRYSHYADAFRYAVLSKMKIARRQNAVVSPRDAMKSKRKRVW